MLTKHQFFYDHTTKQALGFQNPFYLKKAQQLEPKLYDGNVIKNTSAIVIFDFEETLVLAEESCSKMLLKQQDLMMLEKKNSMNSSDPTHSCRPTKVKVPKELPKVSMVNTSLKKLKHHLAGFDVVVKERTMATDITEGSWGFEHTKACFKDEIIPFAVEQRRLESKTFEVKMNKVLNENERLLEQVINKDIMNIIMNSTVNNSSVNVHECEKCLKLETELLNKKDFIEKETYNKLFRSFTTLEKHCISLESQEKDTVIKKLKEIIKSLSENMNEDKVKKDIEEIETINIELDHKVSKLIAENEHLKQTYKQLYDSIKPTRIRSKEQCDALINQVNQKSVEIFDLNVSLQEQGLVITALKDELRKLKEKGLADNVVTKHTIAPEMLKIDVETLNPRSLNNRSAHFDYLKHTQEEAVILRDIVELGKSQHPLNNSLDSALAVTLKNKGKRVRFTEPVTSSGNTHPKTDSSSNLVSNKHALCSTGVRPSTSASGSQPLGNTKNDKIQRPSSSTLKNKVEAHPRTVKSSLKNKNSVVEPKGTANVQHSKLNENSELLCVKCNGYMLSDIHDLCVLDFINDVNARAKSKSIKKSSKRKVWKPTGKVFTNIRYTWRPTSRTFTIVGNTCPLTRITTSTEVPLRKPTALESDTPKPVVTLVYSRKPKKSKTNVPVVQIVLWYLDSDCSKHMTRDRFQLINFINKFLGTVKFGNDHMAKILGYGDDQIRNVTISRVYYVEGLGHNLFSVRQFCDSNLEVDFRQHTCFIRNLEGVDLLTGSRGNNLYTLSLGDMMVSSPISRHDLVRGLPKLKFEKDHLCSACAIGKSKNKPHKPKSEDTNQEKLYPLHMDLCGPMRVASQNGVVERRNRTLIEAARTMLIYAKAPLFLWAKAVAAACYTKNYSIIRLCHEKTPYELLHDKLPDLSFFHVFGALCYPTNDSENLGKLQPKADIDIFIGYAPIKKAFRIYNRRTRRIIKTIHVDFDELTVMASEHSSSGLALHEMTPATISSELVPNPPPSTLFVPLLRTD
ncbi:integrase, catalytic region, zinc finger, CCHC-type containing protein [Tanacetum coccineum]